LPNALVSWFPDVAKNFQMGQDHWH